MIPDFEDGMLSVQRDANALAVVALTLGASGIDSPSKDAAYGLTQAAKVLADSTSKEDVKKNFSALKEAREQKSSDNMEWAKVASLRPLMKNALPALSTEIKRLARNEKTFLRGSNSRKVIDDSTIIVAIALGCRENLDETAAPNEEKLWLEYCERLASAALDFNERASDLREKKGSFDEMKAAFKTVEETCSETCHEKFGGRSAE